MMIKFRTIIFTLAITVGLFGVASYAAAATINKTPSKSLQSGLVGWYTFDGPDTSPANYLDKSGNNLFAVRSFVSYPAVGKIGQAALFNHSFAKTADIGSLSSAISNAMTICSWFKPTAAAGDSNSGALNYGSPPDGNGFGIITNSSLQLGWGKDSSLHYKSEMTLTLNKWTHACLRYDGARMQFYKDGVIVTDEAQALGNIGITNNYLDISARGTNQNAAYNGYLDDARFYSRALSSNEIIQIYNLGVAKINASTVGKGGSLTSGLVGHWTFDGKDLSGTQAYDRSGQNNTGTRNGGTSITNGKIGQAMKFDGSTSYIDAGTGAGLNIGTNDLTISLWMKRNITTGVAQRLVIKRFNDNRWYDLYLGADNKPGLSIAKDYPTTFYSIVTSNNTITDKNWHHIVGTVKRTGLGSIYIDGVFNGSSDVSSNAGDLALSTAHLYIGTYGNANSPPPSQVFNGSLDDVRIYNRALSALEIKQLYNISKNTIQKTNITWDRAGLVGEWTFDGKDGLLDQSGLGNNGTQSGGITKVNGKIGQALKFNGSTGYLDVGNGSSLNIAGPITISAWVKPTAVGTYIIVSKQSGGIIPYQFAMISDGTLQYSHNGPSTVYSKVAMTAGQWQHVVVTWDGSNVTFYRNGINFDSKTLSGVSDTNAQSVNIGSYNNGAGVFFNGSMDDVRIYSRALSAQEVWGLYLMGK